MKALRSYIPADGLTSRHIPVFFEFSGISLRGYVIFHLFRLLMPKKQDFYLMALVNQDTDGIERIYLDFADRVAAFIRKHGGNAQDAKDVMQDALLVIWNKTTDPDFELTTDFYNYLIAVCRNIWFRKKKKKDNNTVTLNELAGFTSEQSFVEALENSERQKLFAEHLSRLDGNCQRILKLFFQGKSMDYIAEIFSIESAHAARNRKYRCQKKLESNILKDRRFKDL